MSQVTFLTSALKAIQPFMSTEQARYYICGVCIHKGRLIATDGYKLAVIKPFLMEGAISDKEHILSSQSVKAILAVKPLFKKMPLYVTITEKAAIIHHGLGDDAKIIATITVDFIDGTFPDWRRVIPARENFTTPAAFGANAEYLGMFKGFGNSVSIIPNNSCANPCVIMGTTTDFEAFGVLMPMRVENVPAEFPEWIK